MNKVWTGSWFIVPVTVEKINVIFILNTWYSNIINHDPTIYTQIPTAGRQVNNIKSTDSEKDGLSDVRQWLPWNSPFTQRHRTS